MSEFDKVVLNNNEKHLKIRLSGINWTIINADKSLLFDAVCDLILDVNNLYYYASCKSYSMTTEEIVKHIETLNDSSLLSTDLKDIFTCIGWMPAPSIDNTVFQGDLSELLMCILIDKLKISNTLISNVYLKTSPGTAAHGNDNIFYDYKNKILYYGESKFYESMDLALTKAYTSLTAHASNNNEIAYIRTHTVNFIAENATMRQQLQQTFESIQPGDYSLSSITFVMEEDKFIKSDVESILLDHPEFDSSSVPFKDCYVIVFPILKKRDFLNHFLRRVGEKAL